MTLITKSEELMAVSVRQGVELAAIEAKVLLGYLEGHDYSLMMDDKFHPVSYTHLTLPTICSV